MNDSTKRGLRAEIEAFRQSQLNVYRAQRGRLQRDASSAKEVVRDHVGRWPYELLQNAEDASASTVVVRFTKDAIYFADNGTGLPAGAVESLSGTHFSEKPAGSIGRKGLGFKAVYCVSPNPAVISGPEGVYFEREVAVQWMKENELATKHVPYQWLPFWLSRSDEEERDGVLSTLSDLLTVVRLPIPDKGQVSGAWKLMNAFKPETLLTFRHVRRLEVRNESDGFDIQLVPGDELGIVRIQDGRTKSDTPWKTSEQRLSTPLHLLEAFEEGPDRDRVRNVDVRVAAPMDEKGHVVPLKQRPCLYVYYPTEELSPVRALLHGDFLIKSDRTAIVPLAETPFNQWIARELASLLVTFVSDCYTPEEPAANVRLLLTPGGMRSEESRTLLWAYISEEAKARLLLPDTTGSLRLKAADARRLDLEGGHGMARKILHESPAIDALVHPAFDEDEEASKVLVSLGVAALDDSDIIECIRERAGERYLDQDWIWYCWEWLAEWAGNDAKRIEVIKTLPVIPDKRGPISGCEAEGSFVTWVDETAQTELPDWLPLRFVADWFRDKLLAVEKDAPVRVLTKSLHIQKPTPDIALRALASAAKAYWDAKQGDPARFLRLLIETNWFESKERPEGLALCPVPARSGNTGETWAPAQDAYFGEGWGEKRLTELYEGNNDVFWALPGRKLADKKTVRHAYEWLGVQACPRVVSHHDANDRWNEMLRVRGKLPNHTCFREIPAPKRLEHIDVTSISTERIPILLYILAANWDRRYAHESHESISYRYYSWNHKFVPSLWWEEVLTKLSPPVKGYRHERVVLKDCWLAIDKLGRLHQLLPCIDLAKLTKSERVVTQKWLREVVKLRQQPEQIRDDEAAEILKNRIPALIPESACADSKQRDHVARWYNAILEALHSRDREARAPDLSECPLLCNKGETWAYVGDEDVWLNDDNDALRAFTGDIWTISLKSTLHRTAEQSLGVKSLAASKDVEFHWDEVYSGDERAAVKAHRLERLLDEVKPFLLAWVGYNRPAQDEKAIKESLSQLRVNFVRNLKASIRLEGVKGAKDASRAYAVSGCDLLLDVGHASETSLAKALAEALNRVDDADFYDVLLRCQDAQARRAKLVEDRNLPESELDRYVAEWRGEDDEFEELPEPGEVASEEEQDDGDDAGDRGFEGGEEPALYEEPNRDDSPAEEHEPSGRQKPRPKLKLKKPGNVRLTEIARTDDGGKKTGVAGGGGGDKGREELSAEERAHVETASRAFVCAELQRRGYEVEEMDRYNPGFDIRAIKPGVPTLLIEVKGHIGESILVDLTIREYEEYIRHLSSNDVRWELWNIVNLSADREGDVLFSRHSQIPEEAIAGVRQLRVNLRRCRFIDQKI
jgi:hypothetical protein